MPDSIRKAQRHMDSSERKKTDSAQRNALLGNKYFSYTGSYVSKLEGQYHIDNLFQQVFTYGATVQLSKELPVNVLLSGRKTNSPYFRDYLDFTINAQPEQITRQMAGKSVDSRKNRLLREAESIRSAYNKRLNELLQLQNKLKSLPGDSCLSYYVQSRELLASEAYYQDSVSFPDRDNIHRKLADARQFMASFDSTRRLLDSFNVKIDQYINTARLAFSDLNNTINDIRSGKALQTAIPSVIRYGSEVTGFDSSMLQEKTHWLQNFRRLALGRSFVDGSQLTLRDISVKGLQAEYQAEKYFYSVVAGWTDFGLRDFLGRNDRVKLNSLVYAATIGKGKKDNNYISLGVFGGQKPGGYAGSNYRDSGYIWGLSLAGQYQLRYWTVNAELAQSNGFRQPGSKTSGDFDLSDKSNKAAALQASGAVRAIALHLTGYVRYYGANFQGFNAYRINAANTLWGVEASKSFFRQSLQLEVAVKTDDYRNPYVEQVYDGRNIIQSFSARFNKGKLTVSASYKPVYQYLGVNDSLFEARFQVLQGVAGISYKTGDIPSNSSLLFNRFTSRQTTQQYFFGNSYNLVASQSFFFPQHSALLSGSYLANERYTYWLVDGCIQYKLHRSISIKIGGRMYALHSDTDQTRVGAYGGTIFSIKHIGQFSLRCESNYFPDLQYRLYGNTMATVGFSTRFK